MNRVTRFRFTVRAIEQLQACPLDAPGKGYEVSDTEIPGLRLSVSKGAGRKTFWLRYTFKGTKRAMRLGGFPATSLADARRLALEARGQLDRGIDPQEGRDLERSSPTLANFAKAYLEDYAKVHKRSWRDDQSKLDLHVIPFFGAERRLCDIQRRDIERFIGAVRKTHSPATANRFLSLLSAMMRRGVTLGVLPDNPCRGIPRFRENSGKSRYLNLEEVGRLVVAMDKDPAPSVMAALRFMLLTGCRRSNALKARWEHMDLTRRIWFMPMTKSGKPQYSPLSDECIALLSQLKSGQVSPWVFPSPTDSTKPLRDPRKAFARVLAAAGIKGHVRLHDIRHTHAALAVSHAGQTLFTVQKLLHHASPQTTMIYSHMANSTLARASQAVSDVITRATQAAKGDDVAPVSEEASLAR
ncbi:tyrosine-type recombinase/integrase [Zoogloea sp.]|uniref:tyrosine-type recombinase/integrase n=1 Tax=Zoogloea sp. TaxID=49181 RepID=UPI002FE2266A